MMVVRLMRTIVLIGAMTSSHLQSYLSISVCSRHHQWRTYMVLRLREACRTGQLDLMLIKNDVETADLSVQDAIDFPHETHQDIAIANHTKRSRVGLTMRLLDPVKGTIDRKTTEGAIYNIVVKSVSVDHILSIVSRNSVFASIYGTWNSNHPLMQYPVEGRTTFIIYQTMLLIGVRCVALG